MERAPRVDKVRDLPRSAHVGPVRELVPHFVTPSAHSNWYCSGAETKLIVNISLLSDSSALWQDRASFCLVAVTLMRQDGGFLGRILIKRTLIAVRGAWAPSLIGKCRAYCEPIIIAC